MNKSGIMDVRGPMRMQVNPANKYNSTVPFEPLEGTRQSR